jgi:GR25 family glycosyltransferase involved in LPS biosynthesis
VYEASLNSQPPRIMNLLNTIADTVLVISLTSREDRRAQIRELFQAEGIRYKFFDGIVPDRSIILLRDVAGMECYGDANLFRGEYP